VINFSQDLEVSILLFIVSSTQRQTGHIGIWAMNARWNAKKSILINNGQTIDMIGDGGPGWF